MLHYVDTVCTKLFGNYKMASDQLLHNIKRYSRLLGFLTLFAKQAEKVVGHGRVLLVVEVLNVQGHNLSLLSLHAKNIHRWLYKLLTCSHIIVIEYLTVVVTSFMRGLSCCNIYIHCTSGPIVLPNLDDMLFSTKISRLGIVYLLI